MDDSRFQYLTELWQEDALSEDELRELSAELENSTVRRKEFLDELSLSNALAKISRERNPAIGRAVMSALKNGSEKEEFLKNVMKKLPLEQTGFLANKSSRAPSSFYHGKGYVLGLAATFIFCFVIWMYFKPVPHEIGVVIKGKIQVTRGEKKKILKSGDQLFHGDKVLNLRSQKAKIQFFKDPVPLGRRYTNEDTFIQLTGLSEFTCEHLPGHGKNIHLIKGEIFCSVSEQPKGRPMELFTQHARVKVLGTRFLFQTGGNSTKLKVQEGTVEMMSLQEKAPVLVEKGFQAIVSKGRKIRREKIAQKLASHQRRIEKEEKLKKKEDFHFEGLLKRDNLFKLFSEELKLGSPAKKSKDRRNKIRERAQLFFYMEGQWGEKQILLNPRGKDSVSGKSPILLDHFLNRKIRLEFQGYRLQGKLRNFSFEKIQIIRIRKIEDISDN